MNTTIQTLIMIGSLGAMMFGMLKFMLRDIHKDLAEMKDANKQTTSRIDHLYQICIELLQTRK